MFRTNDVLLVLMLCASLNWAKDLTELGASPNHCLYDTVFDMYGAYCAGLKLSKLPSLRGGIEILDFSSNKLQSIQAATFSGYTSIKYLYLADNKLYSIDEDGLTSLTYLEILDLSNNVLLNLPTSLFHFPYLRKLNLSDNPLSFQDFVLPRPVTAPLQIIDFSKCKITKLPDWGILSRIYSYNISNNPLTSLDPGHFAAMCSLQEVDLTDSFNRIDLCDLSPTITWFQASRISFKLDATGYTRLNSQEFAYCHSDDSTFEIYNSTYYRCKDIASNLQVLNNRTVRRKWLTVTGSLCGFLVGFLLLLWLLHRVNVTVSKTTADKLKEKPKDADKHANASLLNNAVKV